MIFQSNSVILFFIRSSTCEFLKFPSKRSFFWTKVSFLRVESWRPISSWKERILRPSDTSKEEKRFHLGYGMRRGESWFDWSRFVYLSPVSHFFCSALTLIANLFSPNRIKHENFKRFRSIPASVVSLENPWRIHTRREGRGDEELKRESKLASFRKVP